MQGPKRAMRQHPEWWSLALSFGAWLVLLRGPRGHAHLNAPPRLDASIVWGVVSWLLMVVAMMVPLVIGPIRVTAVRSLWARRHRAVSGFLGGYLGPWASLGVLVVVVDGAASQQTVRAHFVAAAFMVAALWQLSPAKWRAVRACHRTMPLAPRGWRADRDCVSYGWAIGTHCLVSCWALMTACQLAGHSIPTMACASVVGTAERWTARPESWMTGSALLVLAMISAATA